MARSAQTSLVKAVKQAFARALLVQIRQANLKRRQVATAAKVSPSYLQSLLKGDQLASLSTLISLAEGMNVSPLKLLEATLANLQRIRDVDGIGTKPDDRA